MTPEKPDHLLLNGRLQIDTAHQALANTGANPSIEKLLGSALVLHDTGTHKDNDDQANLIVSLPDSEVAKADVVMSLELMAEDPAIESHTRQAARGLLEILLEK